MKKFSILVLCLLLIHQFCYARNKSIGSIPFKIIGSYVVVQMKINNSSKLNFIIDTGLRNTIVTELFPEDSLDIKLDSKKPLQGLGSGASLYAFQSNENFFILNKKILLQNKTIFVLENDIFNLSRQTGTKINGIIGADFFSDYIVEINYNTKKLRFYDKDRFVAPKKYGVMPMIIEGQKMYIYLSVLEIDENLRSIKMLIDTGAELSAWFQTITNDAIRVPDKSVRGRIGEGLSGEINGVFARVPQICIANFCVKNPIVAFPDTSAISTIMKKSDRDGTIGSQLLSKFNLIIDTFHEKLYFKPNLNFKKPFKYNIAGIEIAQILTFFAQVEVIHVWKGSPAEQVDIRVGDVLVEVNHVKLFDYNISQIRGFFEKSSSKPLHIKVQRADQTLDFFVEMKAKI